MATGKKPRTFLLPQGKVQVTVRTPEGNTAANMNMMDAVTIAAKEGFEGFGVWLDELRIPPVLPKLSGSDHEQSQLKERVVEFYHKEFTEAGRKHARSVFLPLLSASGNHGDLMVDLLVQALATFGMPRHVASVLHPLKEFVVVCNGGAIASIIARLAAQLKEIMPPARGFFARLFFRNSVRQQTPVESSVDPSDYQPALPHSSSQSQSAGQSGDSSSQARPARSSGTGNRFPSAYSDAFILRKFSEGGSVRPWRNTVQYQHVSQWKAAHGQSGGDNRQNSNRVDPSARETSGPQPWAQYFVLYDQDTHTRSTYLSSRKAGTKTGKVDFRDTPCITRCWHTQKVLGYYGDDLDNYVTVVTDRPCVGRYKKHDRRAARTSRPEKSDGKMSANDGETTPEDGSKTTASEQASSMQMTTPGAGEKESSEDSDDKCAVCLSTFQRPTQLKKCGHMFCRQCLERSFRQRPHCPLCQEIIVVTSGNMPNGTMTAYGSPFKLPGHEAFTTIVVQYDIYNGVQQDNHPNPGVDFPGTRRLAYLPASEEGFKVCRLLWVAFKLRLTFTVGRSMTSGRDNVVTWNDIHHRTSTEGGPQAFGYPDPDYLSRVTGELAQKGITEEFLRGFDIPF